MQTVKKFLGLLLCVVSLSSTIHAQTLTKRPNVAINANTNGYLEILPLGYDPATSEKYPVLFFFMGLGAYGPGTDPSLQGLITAVPGSSPGNGYIQDQVVSGTFPATFTVNGQDYRFIVIIPQFVAPPSPTDIDAVINYTIANYKQTATSNTKIDTTRIYLTANSAGGMVWDYPGTSSTYANRIAAIVPFSAAAFPSKEKADVIRHADVAVWAFHNEFDDGVPADFTREWDSLLNEPTPAIPEAKATIFAGATSHDSWYAAYNRIYTENGLDIYEWMLQFSRTVTKANAGNDQVLTLPSNSTSLSASWTDAVTPILSYSWQKLSGPTAGTLTNANSATPSVSGLVEGTYIYRVTITPVSGSPATDDVAVTVYPPKIQAESYTTMSGVTTTATTDDGGGITVTNINQGDWMEYTINVPVAGVYGIRFRVSALPTSPPYPRPQFVVKNANGDILTTVNVYLTWDNELYSTMNKVVYLPSGTQTIRIEATNPYPFNINWFQVMAENSVVASPLPVRFSLFNAECTGGNVNLTWKTASEENTLDFSVERSADGRAWSKLATIAATGQSSTEQTYTYKDNGTGGIYRIVANDADGKKTHSSIIKASCNETSSIGIYPNPVLEQAQLNLYSNGAARLRYSVVDYKGAIVLQGEKTVLNGTNQFGIDMGKLSNGSYTLVAEWNGERKTVKFLKH